MSKFFFESTLLEEMNHICNKLIQSQGEEPNEQGGAACGHTALFE